MYCSLSLSLLLPPSPFLSPPCPPPSDYLHVSLFSSQIGLMILKTFRLLYSWVGWPSAGRSRSLWPILVLLLLYSSLCMHNTHVCFCGVLLLVNEQQLTPSCRMITIKPVSVKPVVIPLQISFLTNNLPSELTKHLICTEFHFWRQSWQQHFLFDQTYLQT